MSRLSTNEPFWESQFRSEHRRTEPVKKITPGQVLVLMEMSSKNSYKTYCAIRDGCQHSNLEVTRVDEKPGGMVMRDFHRLISHAQFLIFDLSIERPNVYYELGYAHGIGNHADNVLLVAREGTKIHFDIAGLHIHFYNSLGNLQKLVALRMYELAYGLKIELKIDAPEKKRWWKLW